MLSKTTATAEYQNFAYLYYDVFSYTFLFINFY